MVANKRTHVLIASFVLFLLAASGLIFIFPEQQKDFVCASSVAAETSLATTDIFEDYTQTRLKQEYASQEILSELKTSGEIDEMVYARAIDVLKGNVKYSPQREFSSKFENDHKIDQVGDIAAYSKNELKCIWPASELIITGIYGKPNYAFNVFVEADDTTDKLPSIIFSQNHGYYYHWYDKIQLKKGLNKLTFPTFGLSYIDKDEIRGGAVYLCNPYFPDEQGEVSVYIEGGGYYPVFRKGGNEKEFLNFLKEYESERETKNLLNMAELVTDHAIISTTSYSLYDVYFNNNVITPSENLELWGNYFTTLFEFNGIPTSKDSSLDIPYNSRNDYVKINFRYMTVYQGSGAYSYEYHIGWYYEHYWFANFYNAKYPMTDHKLSEHLIFGIGHELGHALDNEPRKINETTNNFTAAMAYYKILNMPHYEQYQPFEKTLKALASDYNINYKAYDDGQIMYTKNDYPTNYDHNYLIWWDLEAVFPGFWARLNNYFRNPHETGIRKEEQYVYYSSLATGVDLSNYYERWGFYDGKSPSYWKNRFIYNESSQEFKALMKQAISTNKISTQYDHFWYADAEQYNFSLEHQNVLENEKEYINGKPTITKITKSGNKRTLFIQSEKSENHLGYEVMSKTSENDWKVAGFTYSSSFVDENNYASTPTYKVVAVNRFFRTSEQSAEYSNVSNESAYVCKIDDKNYTSLNSAIDNALDGQTIYLLNDCSLANVEFSRKLTIEVDPSVQNDILISTNKSYIHCNSDFNIVGRKNARIIIDGKSLDTSNPVIYSTKGTFTADYVTFQNLRSKFLAAAIYAQGADINISNCIFYNCKDLHEDGIVRATQNLKIENCTFINLSEVCVNISNLGNLTLSKTIDDLTLNFDDFDDEKIINLDGEFLQENIGKIKLKSGYLMDYKNGQLSVKKLLFNLKFFISGSQIQQEVKTPTFVFGSEDHNYNLSDNQYVQYMDKNTNKIYLTGDEIQLEKDMEFDCEIKEKIEIKMFYDGGNNSNFYHEQEEVYLPTIDENGKQVFAYLDGQKIYYSGQVYKVEKATTLTAIYEGNFVYRYIVRNKIHSVGYDTYGKNLNLLQLGEKNFLGWQCGGKFVTTNLTLQGDSDLIAVFGEEGVVYDLSQCNIVIDGNYTYSGQQIIPNFVVYYNDNIVPSIYYSVSYFDNVDASNHARIVISGIEGISIGNKTEYFTISAKKLLLKDVRVEGLKNYVYDGNQTRQNLTLYFNNIQIETYSMRYIGDRTNAGDVQVEISFSNNFSGTILLNYKIEKAARADFRVSQSNWTFGETKPEPQTTGKMETSSISFYYSTLENGEYSSSIPKDAGSYWIKAKIDESTNYLAAEYKAQFKILPKEISVLSFDVQDSNLFYTGQQIKPKVEIKNGETILKENVDYSLTYQNNINAGKNAAIKIQGLKNYAGTKNLTFEIKKATSVNFNTTIHLQNKFSSLSEVELPNDFEWDMDSLEQVSENEMKAVAIYTGSNYDINRLEFRILIDDNSSNQIAEQSGFSLFWLAFAIPGVVLVISCISLVIIRHKRNSWWKNK